MNKKANYSFTGKKVQKSSMFFNSKHKPSPSCLNNCVEWNMNVTYCHEKTVLSYVSFTSKNLTFLIKKI